MRCSGAGMPTSCSSAMARCARLRLATGSVCVRIVSIDLLADAVERIEAGQRVLEHHADALAAHLAHLLGRQVVDALPASRTSPPAMRPGGSIRPITAAPVIDLPAPDSPTTPSTSPGGDVERHAVDGGEHAAPGRNSTLRSRTERTGVVGSCKRTVRGLVIAASD